MRRTICTAALTIVLFSAGDLAHADPSSYFEIRVVDEATGRGIPMVELRTTAKVRYYTDSAGRVAIREPGLMDRRVFFKARTPGYDLPKRGWIRGFRVRLEAGGSKTVEMKRRQPAERIYRVTGQGIYRATVRLGKEAPIKKPLLNAEVAGQDSVHTVLYENRLYWFWGDTTRPSFPLGNFETTGAVSTLPSDGGLDPARGVNLDYFENDNGFVRKMCPIEGKGPVWTRGHVVLKRNGEPRLLCHYARMKKLGERREHGIAVWNDEKNVFEKTKEFPLDKPLQPHGHPIPVMLNGEDWLYYSKGGYPVVRVRAQWDDVLDPTKYEAFTCLEPGARWNAERPPIERDDQGRPIWGWKADTGTLHGHAKDMSEVLGDDIKSAPKDALIEAARKYLNRERFLRAKELMKPEEGITHLRDVRTGDPVLVSHRSSVHWNPYREKWTMLFQATGEEGMGEVWYAEADTLLGPWVYARRVASHGGYSFYNVKQHPYFAQDGGRVVYFEGTYSKLFTDKQPTPRYNYNQLMYRLDLGDERLSLPTPVYESDAADHRRYGTRSSFSDGPPDSAGVPFYAMPPQRRKSGMVAVRCTESSEGTRLIRGKGPQKRGRVIFQALPAEEEDAEEGPTVPLFEYKHRETGRCLYRPSNRVPEGNYERAKKPLCRVWPSPRMDPPRSGTVPVRRWVKEQGGSHEQ